MKHNLGKWLFIGALAMSGVWYFYSAKPPAVAGRVDDVPQVVENKVEPAPAIDKPPVSAAVVAAEPEITAVEPQENTDADDKPQPAPREPTENTDTLQPATRAAVNALMNTSDTTGLETEPLAGGGKKVNLKQHFRSVPVATRQADGSISVRDYVSPVPEESSEQEPQMDTDH